MDNITLQKLLRVIRRYLRGLYNAIRPNRALYGRGALDLIRAMHIAERVDARLASLSTRHPTWTPEQISVDYDKALAEIKLERPARNVFGMSNRSALFASWELSDQERNLLRPWLRDNLTVDVSPTMSKIEYRWRNGEVVFDKPRLVWECNCYRAEIEGDTASRPACRLHSLANFKALEALLENGTVFMRIDNGPEIIWRKTPRLWTTSVDTFTLMNALAEQGVYESDATSVLDLGCGSGVIGIWLATANRRIRRVTFADWLLTPLVVSAFNWHLNFPRPTNRQADFVMGFLSKQVRSSIHGNRYSVAVCNPPYIPLHFERDGRTDVDTRTTGTELLVDFIKHGPEMAERAYINFSHLALPEAEQAARKHGRRLQRLSTKRVPFTVADCICDEAHRASLIERGLEVVSDPADYYGYYHELGVYRIE